MRMNRLIVVAFATLALWALGLQQAAYACYVGFTPYPDSNRVDDPSQQYVFGQVSQGGSGCCWAFAGWHIGYNHYNEVTTTSPTSYAELSDTISYVFSVGAPAAQSSGNQWYETVQNGQ